MNKPFDPIHWPALEAMIKAEVAHWLEIGESDLERYFRELKANND